LAASAIASPGGASSAAGAEDSLDEKQPPIGSPTWSQHQNQGQVSYKQLSLFFKQ